MAHLMTQGFSAMDTISKFKLLKNFIWQKSMGLEHLREVSASLKLSLRKQANIKTTMA
jgi:hypothetical protein